MLLSNCSFFMSRVRTPSPSSLFCRHPSFLVLDCPFSFAFAFLFLINFSQLVLALLCARADDPNVCALFFPTLSLPCSCPRPLCLSPSPHFSYSFRPRIIDPSANFASPNAVARRWARMASCSRRDAKRHGAGRLSSANTLF